MPDAGQRRDGRRPARPAARPGRELTHDERQALAVERCRAARKRSSPSWCDDVVRRRGRWRSPSCRAPARRAGRRSRTPDDAAVVGAEVVTPVADAVRLVDHEQPDCARRARGARRRGTRRCRTARARRAGGRPSSASDASCDPLPFVVVVAVDRRRAHAAALAASIWLRMSASSGETSRVGPAPASRSSRVATK